MRIRPVKNLTANIEGEIGRANNPLTPVSDRNYHALNGLISYRLRKLAVIDILQAVVQRECAAGILVVQPALARTIRRTQAWRSKTAVAGRQLHEAASGHCRGIAFFAGAPRATLQSGTSIYRSNIHAANLGARFTVTKRVDLYAGYTITKDTGDGRSTATAGATDPTEASFRRRRRSR